MNNVTTFCVGVLLLVCAVTSELLSPCPRLFRYEERPGEEDRWYGTAVLMSENKLYGVWFKLFLDKPATRLGNWFGEVRTYDNNTQFLIYNSKFILEPNEPLVVNFFVDYHRNETAPPKLINFRLNGREMCPESLAVPAPVPPRKLFTNPPASEEATTIAGGIVQSREPLIEATNVQLEGKKSKDDDLWNVLLRVVSVERVRRQS